MVELAAQRRRQELLEESELEEAAGSRTPVGDMARDFGEPAPELLRLQSALGNGAVARAFTPAPPPPAAAVAPVSEVLMPPVAEEEKEAVAAEAPAKEEGEAPAKRGEAAAPELGEAVLGEAPAPELEPAPEAAAEAAAPPPMPVDGGPRDVLASVAQARPSVAGATFAQAQAASGPALERQRAAAEEALPEIPAPTGLPPGGPVEGPKEAPPDEAPPSELGGPAPAAGPAAEDMSVPEAPMVPVTPTVLAGTGPTEQSPSDDAMTRSAQAALGSVDLPGEDVPTTLGPRPAVDLSGEASPDQMSSADTDARSSVAAEKAKNVALAGQDFGENAIWPAPTDEILRSERSLAPGEAPAGAPAEPLMLAPDVAAGLDASIAPVLQQRLGEQLGEYDAGEQQYEADSAGAHAQARQDIATLEDDARKEQTAQQDAAKAEVGRQRGEWRRELDTVERDFSEKSAKARDEHSKKIDAEKRKGEADAEREYAKAEAQAAEKRAKAARDAEEKKREAEEESDGFWGWVKSAAKALIDGLKAAVNFVYDNLRKAVKLAFELAKKLALAAIELARMAIVGLIKAFGAIVKGFVSIAFAAFPEIAARINAKIDAAVDVAVERVNAAADVLKKGVAAVLDFLASAVDMLLGLVQKIYNGVFTVIGMIITGEFQELMRRIGYLIDAARTVPDVFQQAALEELLGGNLDEPLSPAELMQAGRVPPGVEGATPEPADPAAVPTPPWTDENVGVDAVETNFELSPELVEELSASPSGEIEIASSDDATRSMGAVIAEATGKSGDVEPEKYPHDGLTPMQRAEIKWQLMKDGIAKWWSENWPYVIAGAAAAVLGFIALNIVTGGAITAAIPAIMSVLGPLFVGLTVLKLADYVAQYVEQAWSGDIRSGGKSLAKALAAGAIELISYLTFKAAGAALKGAKVAARGALKVAGGAAAAASRGVKFAIARGKVLFKGIAGTALGKGAKKLRDLGRTLLERLRFRKFRILLTGRYFRLEGFINPWVTIAKGEIKVVKKGTKDAVFVADDELKAARKGLEPTTGRLKKGDAGTYKELKKRGRVNDNLTPDHIPSRAALVKAFLEKRGITNLKKLSRAKKIKLKAELRAINEEGITIGTKTSVHKAGRTYGPKNTRIKIAMDAGDLGKAAKQDIEAVFQVLHKRGELTPEIVGSYLKVWNANVARKVFSHNNEANKMFMEYLKLSRL